MSAIITRRFRDAIRYAKVTIRELAEESGYAHVTFDKYLNERPPTDKAARALADSLDRRASKLHEHAKRLREAVLDESGDSGSRPRGRRL
jgi:transcriptional regulator with XRE-family HTH domain